MKKLYLSLLGILSVGLSSSVFSNCNFEGSTFEQERKEAYFWSCNEGIIYEEYINDAKLNQELSRIEMARMLNVFAMKLMGKEEDPSKDCKGYNDLNYNDSIIANRACHLGIMGIGINKFRPKDSVTRAEFGTVLSRILYGDKYNTTSGKYYEKHLKALKDNGVITNTNPSLKEKKGYVLLMLKRYIDNKEKQNIGEEVSYKSDGGYISKIGTNITFSNNKDSITVSSDIKTSKDGYLWSDSLQGPCAPGYHVPSKDEIIRLIDIWMDIRGDELYNAERLKSDIYQNEGIYQKGKEKRDLQGRAIGDIFLSDIYGREVSAGNNGPTYRTRTSYDSNSAYVFRLSTYRDGTTSSAEIDLQGKKTKLKDIVCFRN